MSIYAVKAEGVNAVDFGESVEVRPIVRLRNRKLKPRRVRVTWKLRITAGETHIEGGATVYDATTFDRTWKRTGRVRVPRARWVIECSGGECHRVKKLGHKDARLSVVAVSIPFPDGGPPCEWPECDAFWWIQHGRPKASIR
ncbi:MAG: hypothetical protein WD556_07745 [Actinomycetota bacterium]